MPSLRSRFARCDSTVFSARCRISAICLFVCASAISFRTSCSRGESGSSGPVGVVGHPVAHQRALDGVGQERLAAVHGADRVEQRLVDLALEHVAGRAGLQRVEHVALVVVHREREHLRLGQVGADLACGLQAGHARHRDVHDAQVGRATAARARTPRRRPRPPRRPPCRAGARSAASGRRARSRGRRRSGSSCGSHGQFDGRALAGRGEDGQVPADQQRPLAHAGDAEAVAAVAVERPGEAAAVVARRAARCGRRS